MLKRASLSEQNPQFEISTVTQTAPAGPFGRMRREARRREQFTRLGIVLMALVLSAVAAVPFFFMGRVYEPHGKIEIQMPVTHDMHLHFEQMKSFYNGVASGEVYPRWEEDTNRHFGAPTTSYYPPGIYYLTSLFFAVFGDWWLTLLSTYWLMMLGSAVAIYFYARQTMSRRAAGVTMAAYIFMPYHILDQYQRGAMAELLGFVWMPMIMLFGERLFRSPKASGGKGAGVIDLKSKLQYRLANMAGLAASYGAFLWSHPPTAYQFTLAFGLCVLILAVRRRDIKGLINVGVSVAIGLALSGAYLISAAVEQDLIRHEYVSENWPYHTTYVFFHDLPYRDPHMGFFNLIDATWIAAVVGIAVTGGALAVFGRKRRLISGALAERVVLWVVMGCFVAFMMTRASYYLGGRYVPKIDIGVFTWRMLSISTFAVALLTGACVEAAIRSRRQKRKAAFWSVTGASLLAACGGIAVTVVLVVRPMYLAPAFETAFEHFNLAMVPRTAPEDPRQLPHLDEVQMDSGKGSVEIERWDPQRRLLRVSLPEDDRLFVRTFDFPGWSATVDEQPAEIITSPDLGEIVLDLPAGDHVVALEYATTPIRRAGNLMTIASSIAVLLMAAVGSMSARRARG